jgi:hypothetical protein
MRSRLLLLSCIIGTCVVAAPASASAQRIGRYDRDRYEREHSRYELQRRVEHTRLHAAERAARGASRAEMRVESRDYAALRRTDRAYLREERAMRQRERSDERQAIRVRTRYRW